MKHTLLRIALFSLMLTLLFSGCNRSTDYRSDIDVEEIAETITPLLNHPETLVRYDADQIHFFLGLPEPYCTDCVVMVQTRADSVDEYGIFFCKNEEDAEELEEMLDDYLELTIPGKLAYLNDCADNADASLSDGADTGSSARTESRSLTGRVRRYGQYVCYTLLDEEADDALQEQLKSLLRTT